jgi:AcrR family transcriptional regulator
LRAPRRLVYTVYMDTRARILRAARKLFDEKGLEQLSLRSVAKRVGITPMAIYRHFGSKQALVDALVLDGLAQWSARVDALPPAKGLAKLKQIGEAFLDFALKEPRRFEAAFLIHSKKARRYPGDFVAGRSPAGKVQIEAIEQAMADGILRADSAIEIMMTNAALGQGLVTLYRAGRIAGGETEFRKLYRRAIGRVTQTFMTEEAK